VQNYLQFESAIHPQANSKEAVLNVCLLTAGVGGFSDEQVDLLDHLLMVLRGMLFHILRLDGELGEDAPDYYIPSHELFNDAAKHINVFSEWFSEIDEINIGDKIKEAADRVTENDWRVITFVSSLYVIENDYELECLRHVCMSWDVSESGNSDKELAVWMVASQKYFAEFVNQIKEADPETAELISEFSSVAFGTLESGDNKDDYESGSESSWDLSLEEVNALALDVCIEYLKQERLFPQDDDPVEINLELPENSPHGIVLLVLSLVELDMDMDTEELEEFALSAEFVDMLKYTGSKEKALEIVKLAIDNRRALEESCDEAALFLLNPILGAAPAALTDPACADYVVKLVDKISDIAYGGLPDTLDFRLARRYLECLVSV
jgi:hypothetical protein